MYKYKYKIEAVKVSDKEAIRIKKDNKEFVYQSKEPLILIDNDNDVAVKIYPLYSKLYEPEAEIEIKENKRSGCKYIILDKNGKRKPISIGEKININGKKYKLIRLK